MPKPIWFSFYPNDFLSSTRVTLMTTEEIGAYLLLLCHEWMSEDCSLPIEEDKLHKLSRFSGDLSTVMACFIVKRGKLYNERLLSEWNKVNHYKELCSTAGKNGADRRWPQRVTPPVTPPVTGTQHSSPSPSPSPRTRNQEPSPSELKTSREVAPLPRVGKGVMTWEQYRAAYRGRYGADPVRNQTINSQIARLVDRLGAEDAPEVAAFYLSHNDPFYVRKRHPVGLLLQDAESLRTQWATGIKATTGEAKNAEVQDNVVGQAERIIANMQRKGTL